MRLVWVTGVPGTGKSTVRRELVRRGHAAFDADEDGFRMWRDTSTQEPIVDPGRGHRPPDWRHRAWYPIVPERVEALRERDDEIVYLAGSVPNERDVWELFDRHVCLVVDDDTLRHRILTRTDNAFGKEPDVLETIISWNADVRERYTGYGAVIVDASLPVEVVADAVVAASV